MFCRNCGKDIGESNFCPDCGTKQRSDEELKASLEQKENVQQPQMVFGSDGSTRTSDGKMVYSSAKLAVAAAKKENPFSKATVVLSAIIAAFAGISIFLTVLSIISDKFNGIHTAFVVPLMAFAGVISIPVSILSIFIDKRNARWLKENNVDLKQTIRNGESGKDDKSFATMLIISNHIKDVPKFNVFSIIGNAIGVILMPILFALFGAFLATLEPYMKGLFNGDSSVLIDYLGMLALFLVCILPSTILRKIQESKAKKHYEQGDQPQNNGK